MTGYDSKTKLWTVTYEADGVSEEFDYEDMNKYVIDRICGTAPADGGAALKRNAEASHNGDSVSTWGGEISSDDEPEPEPAPTQYTDDTVDWHSTVNNESWNEILQHCKVPSHHVREYLYWCKTKFKIGNKKEFKKDPEALFFPSPMGTRNRNPKFNADCKFPIAAGQAWEDHLSERAITIRKAQHSIDRALRIAESAFQEETNLSTRAKEFGYQIAAYRDDTPRWYAPGVHTWIERLNRYTAGYLTNFRMGSDHTWYYPNRHRYSQWRERIAAATGVMSYVDPNGIPIPPTSTTELYKRSDPKHIKPWDEALRKEWNGLCDRCVHLR